MSLKMYVLIVGTVLPLMIAAGCTGGRHATAPETPVVTDAPIEKTAVSSPIESQPFNRVVMISIDGLPARFIEPLWKEGSLPTLARLKQEGASTHEARADVHNTTTMPNHTSMLTGLPVAHTESLPQTAHHGYIINVDPPPYATLHNAGNGARNYIPSVFDVAHDRGVKTCLFASKSKFVIYDYSYNEKNGAPDTIGENNGNHKIDIFHIDADTRQLVAKLLTHLRAGACELTLLHIMDPDGTGHAAGWGSDPWNAAVQHADALVGKIVDAIGENTNLNQKTTILLTSDHGGSERNHWDVSKKEHFAIPFYVWGPKVPPAADLYKLLTKTRRHPGDLNPPYTASPPPIRNGDLGNTALRLLGLPLIPGSVMKGLDMTQP